MSTSPAPTIQRRRSKPAAPRRAAETAPLLDLATSPPGLRSGTIRRPTLVKELLDAHDATLAVIVAPPGYGKSTLLAEWAEHDPRPFVWLALGQDPPGTISALMGLPPGGASDGLALLVRQMASRHTNFVVVLDDAHLVAPAGLRDAVEAAMHELPAGSTIALGSRTEPPLPIARLRTHRLLSEIRIQQLAMTATEAGELLDSEGLALAPDELQELVRRTQGWPAALYLAVLATREDPDALTAFGGGHHLLSEYLRDEVLASLPPDALRFSTRTSMLDELSGTICDAVLEQRGSAVVLQQLAQGNPLLVPVDVAHHRYRWHKLMRAALERELRQIEPELEPQLRLRASSWYSTRGDIDHAIDQAAGAGDAELTGDLLWPNILTYALCGRNDLLRDWLHNFGSAQIAESAPLALSAAFSSLIAGGADDAQHWSRVAASALERGNERHAPSSLRTGLAVIESMIGHAGVDRVKEVAISAHQSEAEDSMWRPVCLLLAGVAAHLQGDRVAAEPLLEESVRLAGDRAPALLSLALAQRAMIAIENEDWESAEELSDRAVEAIENHDLSAEPLSALVYAAAAAARAHQGRIDEAKSDLRTGIDLLTAIGEFVPWYGAEARILLAQASLWLADVVGARTLLAQASRFARRTAGATTFSQLFDHAWAYMDTLGETSLAGPSSLTIAELRILRFLPNHCSFREIGVHLGVSANTVKTQAHAVYRKLGAASRSEAVAHAIDAGLLGQ